MDFSNCRSKDRVQYDVEGLVFGEVVVEHGIELLVLHQCVAILRALQRKPDRVELEHVLLVVLMDGLSEFCEGDRANVVGEVAQIERVVVFDLP